MARSSATIDQEIRCRHQVFRIRMFHAKALQRAQVIPVSQLLEQLLLYYPKAISELRPKLPPDVMPEIILADRSPKACCPRYDKSDFATSHMRSNRESWGQPPNLKLSRRDNSVTVPITPTGSIAALGALSSSATSKWWIRARIEDVAVDKKVGQLCRENGEFWIAVECMRHAFEGMKFHRDLGILKLLNEPLAAFDRNGDIFHPVENHCRREAGRNVGRRIGRLACRVIAACGQHAGRDVRRRIVSKTNRNLGADAGIAAGTFEFRELARPCREQRMIAAGRVTHHADALRIDAKTPCVRTHPAYGSLRIMNQRRITCLSSQTILSGDGNISARGKWLDSLRQRFFVATREAAAVKVDSSHLFGRHPGRRPVDVELQIHVAAFTKRDILFDGNLALRRFRNLRRRRTQCRNCGTRDRGSNETSPAYLAHAVPPLVKCHNYRPCRPSASND